MSQTFVILTPFESTGAVARVLREGLGERASVLVPEARGLDFLRAEGELAERLDRWWGECAPRRGRMVYLLLWEEGALEHLHGLGGEWLLGVPRPELVERCEAELPNCFATATGDPVRLAELAVRAYSPPSSRPAQPYTPGAGPSTAPPLPGPPAAPALPWSTAAPAFPVPRTPGPQAPQGPAPRSPWEILMDVQPLPPPAPSASRRELLGGAGVAGRRQTAERPGERRGGGLLRAAAELLKGVRPAPSAGAAIPGEALDLLMAKKPLVVAIGSRKGGTGKTTFAASLGQVFGELVDPHGGWTLLIDANTTNPDAAWALSLDPSARGATFRDVVTALAAGREPPDPTTFFALRGLAAYPEDRSNVEPYTFGEIQGALNKVKRRNLVTIVDLPNMLPDVSTRAGQAVAAWLEEAGCVVIPTEATREALMACLEMLEATPSGTPAVVAYIESGRRAIRQHTVVHGLLEQIVRRAACVVGVPDDDSVQLAKLDEKPIADASRRLRAAYMLLSMEVLRHARPGLREALP